MKLEQAVKKISKMLKLMDADIGEPAFDEWVLTAITPKGWVVLEYGGQREDEFLNEFADDISTLREEIDLENPMIGDFAFTHEGHGKGFDAHMCVGKKTFILFNNTQKNTSQITSSPYWKAAQTHFVALLDDFIADPLA